MSRAERIYRALLRLYPAPFRAEFGEPMSQLFRDLYRDARSRKFGVAGLWLDTLADVLVTAVREHMERNSTMRRIVLIVGALTVGLGIGWVDIHNDEVWAGLLLLLSITFLFGFIDPRSAWRSALLIGVGFPLIHLAAIPLHIISPCAPADVCPPPTVASGIKMLLVLIPALIGAYSGVGISALAKMEKGDLVWWIGSALVGLVVGLLSLRVRPVGNVIMVLGLLGLMVGFTRPSGVWRWALALGLVAGIFHGWGELITNPPDLLLKFFLADIVPAFVGAYVGFGLRWLIDRYLPVRAAEPRPSASAS